MYTLNGWWFLSSGGSYPLVFTVVVMSNAMSSGPPSSTQDTHPTKSTPRTHHSWPDPV